MVVTKRARQDTGRLLLLEGGAVLEPALKFMAVGTEKIKSNHQKLNNMFLFFWQEKTRRPPSSLSAAIVLNGVYPFGSPGHFSERGREE
jgi:hypothetical protein